MIQLKLLVALGVLSVTTSATGDVRVLPAASGAPASGALTETRAGTAVRVLAEPTAATAWPVATAAAGPLMLPAPLASGLERWLTADPALRDFVQRAHDLLEQLGARLTRVTVLDPEEDGPVVIFFRVAVPKGEAITEYWDRLLDGGWLDLEIESAGRLSLAVTG